MTTPVSPPSWHDDPFGARVLRWWDGTQWTEHIAARAYEPLPSQHLEKEHHAATRAHYALIGFVVAEVCAALAWVLLVRRIVGNFDAVFDSDPGDPNAGFGGEGLLAQLLGFAALGLLVLVYLWVYAVATFARAAGLPARREPGLVVASFFIPIVNLWWPYQSICDALPPDHGARRRVLRWWLLLLASNLSFGIAAGAAFLPGSSGYLVALGVVSAVTIAMAIVGQAMIADIFAAHDQLLVERRLTATVGAA